ncbi:putative toxin-antitoxin system toxin component, PIN family [Sphingomonas sp. NCPPB 2930]
MPNAEAPAAPPPVVLDTNLVVSAALLPGSTSGRALLQALRYGEVVVSDATWAELLQVLHRPKFDRYFVPPARRAEFLDLLARSVRWCDVTSRTGDCADPKGNKFLELACDAPAMLIVTGDDDLLRLHPWRGVRIVTPAACMAEDFVWG